MADWPVLVIVLGIFGVLVCAGRQGEGIEVVGDSRGRDAAVGGEAVVSVQEARCKAIIKTEKPGLEESRDVMCD